MTFNLEDHDPQTEDEPPMMKPEPEKREKESQKHDSQRPMKEKARRRTRRRRTGQSSFTNSIDVISGGSVIDAASTSEKSASSKPTSSIDTHQCHTTSSMIDPEGIEDDIRALMNHSLPKSPQCTIVITAYYTPHGGLFGAFTQRGLGIAHASLTCPAVLNAIHNIAVQLTLMSSLMLVLYLLCHLDHLHSIDLCVTRLLRKRCLGILWILILYP